MASILVVDDDADTVASLRDLLGLLPGLEMAAAATFRGGLSLLPRRDWDVVLCDERLPDGVGADLLVEAACVCPRARRLLMSASLGIEPEAWSLPIVPVDGFVEKPWDPEAFLDWLGLLLEGHAAAESPAPVGGRLPEPLV